MTNTNRKSICFAYFADGKFIGWYGGTFGPVSKIPNEPTEFLGTIKPEIQ